MVRGKTIQIYLPDGNPKGIKICEIPNSIIKAILIPRNLISEAIEIENLEKVGIYFLFSEKDETYQFKTYIGEAEEIKKRIKQHDIPDKDYWNYVVCFSSGKDNLNKAHIKFLESFCHEEAKLARRTELMNGCSPTRSTLSQAEKDFALNFYDEMRIILGTLGYPIFDKIKKAEKEEDIFHCKGNEFDATGNLTEEGFVVYAGSKARLEDVPSLGNWVKEYKEALKRNNLIGEQDGHLVFKEDVVMSSPSLAGGVITGRPSNGWVVWKNKNNKTLDEIKRKSN